MYVYALKMLTPVRFGTDGYSYGLVESEYTCHSDTLFSAVCIEWLMLYGEESLEKDLITAVREDKFLISSMFPYVEKNKEFEFYIPKPALALRRDKKSFETREEDMKNRKKTKKLKFIPASRFAEYIDCLKECKLFDFEEEDFAVEMVNAKVAINRSSAESMPYTVSSWMFKENAGLYFLADIKDYSLKEKFDNVIENLGISGIGGKRSSGMGKFEILDGEAFEIGLCSSDEKIKKMLEDKEAGYYMNLSLVCPAGKEWGKFDNKESFYTIAQRTGFVYSLTSNHAYKKPHIVMFGEGSCFKKALKGDILNLSKSENGSHPVYKYGRGMYIGVKI